MMVYRENPKGSTKKILLELINEFIKVAKFKSIYKKKNSFLNNAKTNNFKMKILKYYL